MVKHIIIWKLKDNVNDKTKVAQDIKTNLESLNGKIDGMIDLSISWQHLESSSGDIMLDSSFVDQQALKNYSLNSLHNQIADKYVRPNVAIRLSYDYVIE